MNSGVMIELPGSDTRGSTKQMISGNELAVWDLDYKLYKYNKFKLSHECLHGWW